MANNFDYTELTSLDESAVKRIRSLESSIRSKQSKKSRYAEQLSQLYRNNQAELRSAAANLQEEMTSLNEKMAEKGLFFSGARKKAQRKKEEKASASAAKRAGTLQDNVAKIQAEIAELERQIAEDRSDISYNSTLVKGRK